MSADDPLRTFRKRPYTDSDLGFAPKLAGTSQPKITGTQLRANPPRLTVRWSERCHAGPTLMIINQTHAPENAPFRRRW